MFFYRKKTFIKIVSLLERNVLRHVKFKADFFRSIQKVLKRFESNRLTTWYYQSIQESLILYASLGPLKITCLLIYFIIQFEQFFLKKCRKCYKSENRFVSPFSYWYSISSDRMWCFVIFSFTWAATIRTVFFVWTDQ